MLFPFPISKSSFCDQNKMIFGYMILHGFTLYFTVFYTILIPKVTLFVA